MPITDLNKLCEDQKKPYRYIPWITDVPQLKTRPVQMSVPTILSEFGIYKTTKEEDVARILKYIDLQYTDKWKVYTL